MVSVVSLILISHLHHSFVLFLNWFRISEVKRSIISQALLNRHNNYTRWPSEILHEIMHEKSGASVKEPAHQCRRCKRHRFDPWVKKIPWRRSWQPTAVFLPGESLGKRGLVGYSPRGHKESDTTEAT